MVLNHVDKVKKGKCSTNVGLCPHGCKAQLCKHVKQIAANEKRYMMYMHRPWQK
jgi:hypothetical protein